MVDSHSSSAHARDYGFAVAMVGISTAIAFAMFPHFELTNLVMIYLLGTLVVAIRGHRKPAALSSALSVLCFDFFFVPPRFTLSVSDAQYAWTFAVMFAAAMIISHLTIRLREEAQAAREGEQRTTWLLEKAKELEIEAVTERMRSSLLSSVSHDFRTPLTAIVGSVGALLEKEEFKNNRVAQELLENIQDEGQRLSRLVQNLLEVTRLESGPIEIRKELYPLEEVIGSALERVEKALRGRSIAVNIPEDLPLIPMDALLMEQVFINLFENGLRYTPADAGLEVSAHVQDKTVGVSVSDRGPGLKDDEKERVFDKFYHGQSSPGAGLGLAICRAVVNAHGGHISAQNRAGGGAVFSLTMPLTLTPSPHGRGERRG